MNESESVVVEETVVSVEEKIWIDFLNHDRVRNQKTITCYQFANVLSDLCHVRIREQMMYNYSSKNLITNSQKINKNLVVESLHDFVVKFVSKRISK